MSSIMVKNPLESDGMTSEDNIGKREEYGELASTTKEIIYKEKDEVTLTKSSKVNKKIQRHGNGHIVHSQVDIQEHKNMEEGGKIMETENGVTSSDDNDNDNVKEIDCTCVEESKRL